MVAGGCIVSGATVKHSLLFSNVKVNSHATIVDSVILPEAVIGRNCDITKAIVEKGCLIPEGTVIGKNRVEDEKNYHVSSSGVVLVTPDMLGQERHLVR
jgi:glucose-1-phosphate adenylyltransferase